jgi:hypothetical protein
MDSAGIIPEQDITSQQAQADSPAGSTSLSPSKDSPAQPEPGEERLSVFEDFLQNLNMGDLSDKPDDDEDDDKPQGSNA